MTQSRSAFLVALAALLSPLASPAKAEGPLNADFSNIKEALAPDFDTVAKRVEPMVRTAGKADSWDRARKACADLKPGAWDLPTQGEYFGLLIRGRVEVAVKVDEDSNYYPMWLRSQSEEANARQLAGKGLVFGMQDGKGEDMFPLDVSPAGVSALKAEVAAVQKELDAKNHRTEAEEKKVAEAMAEYRKTNSDSWLNPDVPHPGVFSDEINRILEKTSKKNLVDAQRRIQGIVDAVKDGLPVYCVGR